MARCPDCTKVLINPRQCECGWKSEGALEAYGLERQCSGMHEGHRCTKEGWIKVHGWWWCGPCHEALMAPRDEADRETAKKYIAQIKDILKNAKGPLAKAMGGMVNQYEDQNRS